MGLDPSEAEDHVCEPGAPAWLATTGDLMSPLLVFFVLMLSFANTDKQLFMEAMGSIQQALGVMEENPGTFQIKSTSLIEFSEKKSTAMMDVMDINKSESAPSMDPHFSFRLRFHATPHSERLEGESRCQSAGRIRVQARPHGRSSNSRSATHSPRAILPHSRGELGSCDDRKRAGKRIREGPRHGLSCWGLSRWFLRSVKANWPRTETLGDRIALTSWCSTRAMADMTRVPPARRGSMKRTLFST